MTNNRPIISVTACIAVVRKRAEDLDSWIMYHDSSEIYVQGWDWSVHSRSYLKAGELVVVLGEALAGNVETFGDSALGAFFLHKVITARGNVGWIAFRQDELPYVPIGSKS